MKTEKQGVKLVVAVGTRWLAGLALVGRTLAAGTEEVVEILVVVVLDKRELAQIAAQADSFEAPDTAQLLAVVVRPPGNPARARLRELVLDTEAYWLGLARLARSPLALAVSPLVALDCRSAIAEYSKRACLP